MRDYKAEIEFMIPGDGEHDKLLRKELMQFIALFNEAIPMLVDYDRDVPKWYEMRDDVLNCYKILQNDYLIRGQAQERFKLQLAHIKNRIPAMANEAPLWESIKPVRTSNNDKT